MESHYCGWKTEGTGDDPKTDGGLQTALDRSSYRNQFREFLSILNAMMITMTGMSRQSLSIKPRESAAGHDGDHDHGRTDPHAWQSVANAKIYVNNIRDALIATDPAGKASYEANASAYLAKLDALEREVKDVVSKIPVERRRVLTSHSAFGYFEDSSASRASQHRSQDSAASVSSRM